MTIDDYRAVKLIESVAEAAKHDHQPAGEVHLDKHPDGQPDTCQQDVQPHARHVRGCGGGQRESEAGNRPLREVAADYRFHRQGRQRPDAGGDTSQL